jgi:hypothetical protein
MLALAALAAHAADYQEIVLANKVVARIKTGGDYGSVAARGAKVNQRLVEALSYEDCVNPKMTVAKANGRWTISLGKTMLLQVYPDDTAGTGLTEKALAGQWKAALAAQLPLAVSPIRLGGGVPDREPDPLPSEPLPAGVPPEDLPLVQQLVPLLDRARGMDEAQYGLSQSQMEADILSMIWRYRRGPECGPLPATSDLSVANLLKRVRAVTDERYRIERQMYAGTTIKRVRTQHSIPPGTGPVTPPEPAAPLPLPPPQIQPGTPIARAVLGTRLDSQNNLLNPGQHFPANVPQVMLYLQIKGAPNNTVVDVSIRKDDQIIARKRVQVSGDRPFAVAFYPQKTAGFPSGDYECRLAVADHPAGVIPFRVAAAQ